MKGEVYILQSIRRGTYYIGSSVDPLKRLEYHNTGKVVATRNKGPWKILMRQEYPSIRKARQIEYRLKKLKSRVIIEQIIQDQKIKMK